MVTGPLQTQPARILLAGDWHGHGEQADLAFEYAADHGCDGVIQLGDFGIWPGRYGREFLDEVEESLQDCGLWCAFIDGNHEDFWQLDELPLDDSGLRPVRERLWHIPRGTRWEWAGKTWAAIGGATSLDRKHRKMGVDWWPEETITAGQAHRIIADGPADVLLTHDCPSGVPIPGLSSGWDPHALAAAMQHRQLVRAIAEALQPSRLWHGHFHTRYRADVEFAGTPCEVTGLDEGSLLKESTAIVDVNA